MFGPLIIRNFKTVPKKYTQAQWASKLRFCTGFSMNSISSQVSYLCIVWKSLYTSHSYFYVCTFICHCMFTSTLAMILVCITLEILIVSYPTSPYNLPMFQHPTSMLTRAWKGSYEEYRLILSSTTRRRICTNIF